MAKLHRISIAGQEFHARSGQFLLDAALTSGVDLPHDCRAGRCGSCLTRVAAGITLGGETRQAGMVHACQARIFSDLRLEVEALPPPGRIQGKVIRIVDLAKDVVEVTIEPSRKFEMLPGQYCRFRFRGYPARPFTPTAALGTLRDDGLIRLNIKRVRDGRVSPQIGRAIKTGHAVTIEGPFGHAFLRPRSTRRLVLVGSGTGFAPMWAVAAAALRENPARSIVLVAATRKLASLYMAPALDLASRHVGVKIVACVDELPRMHGLLIPGPAINHLPPLDRIDIVYAAGAPRLVDAVGDTAVAAGATFFADPFESAANQQQGWFDSARAWLRAS